MGLFNPFLYYLVLFKAYDLLEAQEAGTLNYIWPIRFGVAINSLFKTKNSLASIGSHSHQFLWDIDYQHPWEAMVTTFYQSFRGNPGSRECPFLGHLLDFEYERSSGRNR